VARLIDELSDGSARKREAAADSLLRMGEGIEPQLRWALARLKEAIPSSELQMRSIFRPQSGEQEGRAVVLPRYAEHELPVLIDHLEDRRRLNPPLITLHFKDALFTDVLKEFGRQLDQDVSIVLGWEKDSDWVNGQRITINLERGTFWDALAAILHELPQTLSNHVAGQALIFGGVRVGLTRALAGESAYAPDLPASTVSGPFRIAPLFLPKSPNTLTLEAAATPALTGAKEIAMVELDAATDNHGRSLLPEGKRMFLSPLERYGFGWKSESMLELLSWRVPVVLSPLGADENVRSLRGRFGVSLAPPSEQMALPGLGTLLREQPTDEREIDIDPDCGVLAPPSVDDTPYRSRREVCQVGEWKESHIAATDGNRRGYHVYERTYDLCNPEAVPVRFVVSFRLYHGWWIDSVPQPDAVVPGAYEGDMQRAIFVVHASPGEQVHLHVGERGRVLGNGEYERSPEFPVLPPQSFPTGPGLSMSFDGITISVKAMERTQSGYVVRGEMSGPTGAPAFLTPLHSRAVNWQWTQDFLTLRLLDAARWHMESHVEYGEVRHERGRDIVEWALSTNEPGRVPSTLIWYTPQKTRWLTEPFVLRDVTPAAVR